MKSNLTKVSVALFFAVFILGCQDMASGPVGPEGPQFDKRGTPGALCGGPGEPVRDENGHCHSDEEATGIPRYRISLIADIDSVDDAGNPTSYVTNSPLGHTTVKDIFQLDIHSVLGLDAKACLVDLPPREWQSSPRREFFVKLFCQPLSLFTFRVPRRRSLL